MPFETAKTTQAYRKWCEDRVAAFHDDDRTVVVVADGAGGVGSGDLAADFVLSEIQREYPLAATDSQWAAVLAQIDARMPAGEATAVVVDLRTDRICGASVGDSRAWIIHNGDVCELTANQVRKPLLGSRQSRSVGFAYGPLNGLLLVATDGLFDYLKREDIFQLVVRTEFFAIPRSCVEAVRLPSGEYWDDVGIVVCRVKPKHRRRQRYAI